MVVNGDDILFWAIDQEHYDIWKEVTKQCGLKFSLGKNYTSRDVAIINSEMYIWKRTNTRSRKFAMPGAQGPQNLFHKTPALNSRLLAGTTRSGASCAERFGSALLHQHSEQDVLSLISSSWKIHPREWFGLNNKRHNKIIQKNQHKSHPDQIHEYFHQHLQAVRSAFEEDASFAKWRKTLESRQEALLAQAAGDLPRGDSVERDETLLKSFRRTQLHALQTYQSVFPRRDKDTPHYVPQMFGGLGILPPTDHRYTLAELCEVSVFEREPKLAQKWVKRQVPSFPRPDFMSALSSEIRDLSESLEITNKTVHEGGDIDFDTLRHHAQEEKFYDSKLLTGFVDVDSVIVSELQKQESVAQNSKIRRSFNCKELTRVAVQQRELAKDLGYLQTETRLRVRDGKDYADTILEAHIRFSESDMPMRFVSPEPELE